jgi:DNA (cytosine-5)-methyltransferase 1
MTGVNLECGSMSRTSRHPLALHGGGGLDLGIELAIPGARTVCMVEREAFAVAHLVSAMEQGRVHPAPVWSDAGTFRGREWRGCVDGLIGGIPCQPHSLAGKRLGAEDERDLWSVARRIIVQSGAWFILIENVRGMLTSGGAERVWRDVLRLGFAVEGGLFTAAEVGAPHERERFFILAVADTGGVRSGARVPAASGRHAFKAEPAIADDDCNALADAAGARLERGKPGGFAGERHESLRKGRTKSELPERDGLATAIAGAPVADANCAEPATLARDDGKMRSIPEAQRQSGHGAALFGGGRDHVGLFPPGPSDIAAWRRVLARSPDLEPSVRRMVDGMAARVDLSGPHAARVERLRLLGNGVHPLEAAYAIRTLATRLAASGSTGAARLVRLMEAAE